MKTINIKEKFNYFTEKDLLKIIEEKGINEAKFIVPMAKLEQFGFLTYTSSTDKKDKVICTINEDRFKVEDNYKITLIAEDKDNYGKKHYYTSDLASLIKEGYIKIIE